MTIYEAHCSLLFQVERSGAVRKEGAVAALLHSLNRGFTRDFDSRVQNGQVELS